MFTAKDKRKIAKALTDGDYTDILLICMMRNGASIDEIQEIDCIIQDTNSHSLNQIIKSTAKYYNIDDLALEKGETNNDAVYR